MHLLTPTSGPPPTATPIVFGAFQHNLFECVRVYAIAADRGGSLWFGTSISPTQGVTKWDAEGQITTYTTTHGLADGETVTAIAFDPLGYAWFGVYGGGLSVFDGKETWKTFTADHGLAGNEIVTLAATEDDESGSVRLWIGTNGHGASELVYTDNPFERENLTWTTYAKDIGLDSNVVFAINPDPDRGVVWFGAYRGGVSYYDGVVWTSVSGLDTDQIYSIALDQEEGSVWVGTEWNVSRLFDGHWRTFEDLNLTYRIWDIQVDEQGRKWFATHGNGLVVLEDSDRRVTAHSLTSNSSTTCNANVVRTIQAHDGRMWLGTDDGIYSFRP
jgi:streptogramin lyase